MPEKVSDETKTVHGFTKCRDDPDVCKQDKFSEPQWCCASCGTWHITPEKE